MAGAPFRLLDLGTCGSWPVALVEAEIGRCLPRYIERRGWRRLLPPALRDGIVIFTDSAHSSFVWSWRGRAEPAEGLYTEHRVPGREASLQAALVGLRPFGSPAGESRPGDELVRTALLQRICSVADRSVFVREAVGEPARQVEEVSDPAILRRIWRAARSFSVLDTCCRNAERLLGAARELERVHLAVLERMRAFVDDGMAERERRRPEHLRDFRALVELAEGPAAGGDRMRFVRRTVVQQNLFGLAPSTAAARRTVEGLLDYCGIPDHRTATLDCNVARPPGKVRAGDGTSERGEGAEEWRVEKEEVGRFCTVLAAVREIRLTTLASTEEFVAAARQIDARRRLLVRQLNTLAEEGPNAAGLPVETRLRFGRNLHLDGVSVRLD